MFPRLRCPAGAVLDTWVAHDWAHGLQIEYLPERESLTVNTDNSRYDLTILCGRTGAVLVRGGSFFPEVASAHLAGSSLGGSLLKLRGIYVGFRMELHGRQGRIITSRVRSIGLASGMDERPITLFS
jgi:hypothetical protein